MPTNEPRPTTGAPGTPLSRKLSSLPFAFDRGDSRQDAAREVHADALALEDKLNEACGLAFDHGRALEALADLTKYESGNPHGHQATGIWDSDNGPDLAGKKCSRCAAFERARALSGKDRRGEERYP